MDRNEGTLQIGHVLKGRYRIAGEGQRQDIGTAYGAFDPQYERAVVVLVLDLRFSGDGGALRRLLRSQQAVTDLAVPELVPVEDAGVLDGRIYLVRSLVDGYTLASVQERVGPLAFDRAVRIALGLCDALSPLHHAGRVHGSLSPYSVLVQDSGEVLLTEVGVLPALRPESPEPGRLWGRIPYVSPEQAGGEAVHPSSDIYVIGCLLYEMLTGRPPFRAQDEAVLAVRHLRHDPPSLSVLVPDVPPRLADVVQKCLAKEPAARYRNAGQLASILRSHPVVPAKPGIRFTRPLISPESGIPPSQPVIPPESPSRSTRPLVSPERGSRSTRPILPPESGTRTSPPVLPAEAGIQRERLVVPPPPSAAPYEPEWEPDEWSEEPAGADWILVALIVAALIAVLGLIPLWRTVYRRYAAPPAVAPPALYDASRADWASLPAGSGGVDESATAGSKLDDFGLVWYNLAIGNQPSFWAAVDGGCLRPETLHPELPPGFGVKITALGSNL